MVLKKIRRRLICLEKDVQRMIPGVPKEQDTSEKKKVLRRLRHLESEVRQQH